jgi:uncharacterized Zn finger protein
MRYQPDRKVEQLVFQVKGSSSDPYEVTFIKDGTSLTALCTCPAGQFGGICKHRVAILGGKAQAITSDNADQVATVTRWLAGTDVEAALAELNAAQKSKETSKDDVATLKRKLARAMHS